MPNSDTGRDAIALAVENYVQKHQGQAKAFTSLGLRRYLSTLQFVKAAVGNSSSGIIEVPSFGIPTLNIGDRQKGRLASKSVVNCGPSKKNVIAGLKCCLSEDMQKAAKIYKNPYAKPNTAHLIYQQLKNVELAGLNLKTFYDL